MAKVAPARSLRGLICPLGAVAEVRIPLGGWGRLVLKWELAGARAGCKDCQGDAGRAAVGVMPLLTVSLIPSGGRDVGEQGCMRELPRMCCW